MLCQRFDLGMCATGSASDPLLLSGIRSTERASGPLCLVVTKHDLRSSNPIVLVFDFQFGFRKVIRHRKITAVEVELPLAVPPLLGINPTASEI